MSNAKSGLVYVQQEIALKQRHLFSSLDSLNSISRPVGKNRFGILMATARLSNYQRGSGNMQTDAVIRTPRFGVPITPMYFTSFLRITIC